MVSTNRVYFYSGIIFGSFLLTIGLLNLFLVHPVPALIYFLLSLIYLPSTNNFLEKKTGMVIPWFLKILLGIFIFLFTFGVSDLGDMIDKI